MQASLSRGRAAARSSPLLARRAARPCAPCSAALCTLYGSPGSRSRVVEWYATEIGLLQSGDLVVKNLDMRDRREHKAADYIKKIHPFGQVPALVVEGDGGFSLFESGAILTYLAEAHGDLPTAQDRAVAAQWVAFANSSLSQAIFFDGPRERSLPSILSSLDALLADRPYLTGDQFTVSDVAVGAYFAWIPRFFGDKIDISPYKNVAAYVDRVLSRPAAKATILA